MKYSFIVVLLIVVLISYGQLLGMNVWQDDNALFFKLAHINEMAGFFGTGPFGEGAYKYIVTPYIPIYKIFGFNTIVYFIFTFLLYLLTTLVVYKVFSEILGNREGRLVSFLYAAGYIASDGFIRLFNSIATSVSIIFISLLTLSYWHFYKTKSLKWYVAALLWFLLATELIRGRTHYLISAVVAFELIFLAFEKPVKSFFYSMFRLSPFVFIFYRYFVAHPDLRTGEIKNLIAALINGEFFKTYSLVGSFSNIVTPDWFTIIFSQFPFSKILVLGTFLILILLLFARHKYKKVLIPIFWGSAISWRLLLKPIYNNPALNLSNKELFVVFLGGLSLLLLIAIFLKIQKYKRLYLFFLIWVFLNLGAYAAYQPTVVYESVNRYLAHSFFASTALMGILYLSFQKTKIVGKVVLAVILLWGIGNLVAAFNYQKNIVNNRSNPSKIFYENLRGFTSVIKKGDIFYFDIADNAKGYFADSFSVASMPEETAIAWRYGVDRYDFRMLTDYKDLEKILTKPRPVITDINDKEIAVAKVYTFFYSKKGLVNTTEDFNRASKDFVKVSDFYVDNKGRMSEIIFTNPLKSVKPIKVAVNLSASFYPYSKEVYSSGLPVAQNTKDKAFRYKRDKESIMKNVKITVSNYWQENIGANMTDGKFSTFWRADRLLWNKDMPGGGAVLTLDLGEPRVIDRFAWVNAFENSSPTEYLLETSMDNKTWTEVSKYNSIKRIRPEILQVENFSAQRAHFIRMKIISTLDTDSPTISEVWAVPQGYENVNLVEIEKYLDNPFTYISTKEEFENVLSNISGKSRIRIYWQGNKSEKSVTDESSYIDAIYDGLPHEYQFTIPAGGTKVDKIVLDQNAHGKIIINSIYEKN